MLLLLFVVVLFGCMLLLLCSVLLLLFVLLLALLASACLSVAQHLAAIVVSKERLLTMRYTRQFFLYVTVTLIVHCLVSVFSKRVYTTCQECVKQPRLGWCPIRRKW